MEHNKPVIRLFITPQTHVVTTQKGKICMAIADEELIEKYPAWYKLKLRLKKYYQYKEDLRQEAARVGFEMPLCNAWIRFYVPVPPSWRPSKKRKMDFMPKQSKPDATNYIKAMEDAMLKEDQAIWDYRCSKFWYNSVKGFIEIDYNVEPALGHRRR